MKNRVIKIFTFIFSILILSISCDGMKKELNMEGIAFPPKLCVTAILDGANGTFSIVISEGRSLADYIKPLFFPKENKRNGEIRLYEDGRLILSEIGVFDLANIFDDESFYRLKTGHRFDASGIVTHPGSTYRLEVEIDGYKTVSSNSIMPFLPDVSATIDTLVTVKKSRYKEYSSLSGWNFGEGDFEGYFWTAQLQWGERQAGRNYYALEMYEEKTFIEGTPSEWSPVGIINLGIYVSDLSKLQDNPEVEMFETLEIDFETSSTNYDIYKFPILLMSDIGFTNDNASLTLYKQVINNLNNQNQPDFEVSVYNHKLTLRVMQITEETFRYYRSLTMQSAGMGFFSEPVNIISNIENGYGGFTVFNAVDIRLLEYESEEYWGDYSSY